MSKKQRKRFKRYQYAQRMRIGIRKLQKWNRLFAPPKPVYFGEWGIDVNLIGKTATNEQKTT